MRKLLLVAAGLFAFWNLQAVGDIKEAIVELLVVGKLPGAEVYLNFTTTLIIIAVLISMLIQWGRSLMTDFVEFSLEMNKQEATARLAAEKVIDTTKLEPQLLTHFSEGLTEDELDLMSV